MLDKGDVVGNGGVSEVDLGGEGGLEGSGAFRPLSLLSVVKIYDRF